MVKLSPIEREMASLSFRQLEYYISNVAHSKNAKYKTGSYKLS